MEMIPPVAAVIRRLVYLGRNPKMEIRYFPYLNPRISPRTARTALPKISPTINGQLVSDHTCVCKGAPSFPTVIKTSVYYSVGSGLGLSVFAYFPVPNSTRGRRSAVPLVFIAIVSSLQVFSSN